MPAPESSLGFKPGDDYKLATYDQAIDYFRKLDAASDRLTLIETGRTSYGHPWTLRARVEPGEPGQRREVSADRAAARAPDGPDRRRGASAGAGGKAFVHIDGGLHSTEVAGGQHTLQLAYDLLAHADDPKIKPIFDNVILMLWPSINPDGQNIVAKWYMGNVGTPFETAPLTELYQKYIGHDNNRDAYMLNMVESREMSRAVAALGAADHLRAPPDRRRFRRASGCRHSPSPSRRACRR